MTSNDTGLSRRTMIRAAAATAAVGGLGFVSPHMPPAAAATFKDTVGNPFRADIEWMAAVGISKGWPDGTFRPLLPVKRDAMAAFVHRFAGSPPARHIASFTDVKATTQFAAEMSWMKHQGISWGWVDGTYRPLAEITRDAMAAFLYRLLDRRLRQHGVTINVGSVPQFRDVRSGQLFAREMRWMRAAGISTGWPDNTYRPLQPVLRQDMAAFMRRAAQLAEKAS